MNEFLNEIDLIKTERFSLGFMLRNDFFLDRKEIDTIKKVAKRHDLYVCASYVNGCCRILVEKPTDKRYK
jgi:hypothetical protein